MGLVLFHQDWAHSRHGRKRNAYRISVGKHDMKKPVLRLRRKWGNNIKIYLKINGIQSLELDLLWSGNETVSSFTSGESVDHLNVS